MKSPLMAHLPAIEPRRARRRAPTDPRIPPIAPTLTRTAPLVRPPALHLAGVPRVAVVSLLALAAVSAVVAPLATYATTLAVFGLPHVVQEMRYIRHRFAGWVGLWLVPVAVLLAAICAGRLAMLFDLLDPSIGRVVELGLAAALVLAVAPAWARGGLLSIATGLLLTTGLVLGLLFAPIWALLAIAVLHNWTPVPFVLEASRRADRSLVLAACALVFLVVPGLIATGLPWELATALGLGAPEWSLLDAGTLTANLRAYLPDIITGLPAAQHIFSAIVFAQCTHYVMILLVLPSLSGPAGRLRTPAWTWVGIVAISIVITAVFLVDFRFGRAFYGAFAAVHAWIEVPLFLLVLAAVRAPSAD